MKEKIVSIFVFMLLITVIFSASGTLSASNEIENPQENISNEITDEKTIISSTEKAWTVVTVYPIPEGASGLAYDGTYLYCGIYGSNGDEIYQIDPTDGSYSLLCTGPQNDAFGLTYDGTYFWTTDHPSDPAVALQFDMGGNLVSQFNLPAQYMSGIANDSGDFWVAAYYPDPATIYKVNDTGYILDSFTAPDNQPWDLCLQDENLWMADYWGDTLYQIDPSDGSVLASYASESTDPAGIVWDGNYLWYCDNGVGGVDYLYKIDLGGSGSPEIQVSSSSHYYGPVALGSNETWNLFVSNNGIGELNISDITFVGDNCCSLSCPLTFPVIIGPGNQTLMPIVFAPLNIGPLNGIGTIWSNDPMNPEVDLTITGYGVNPVRDIFILEDFYNYGSIRKLATKRWTMEIENRGNDPLTISNIDFDNNAFYLDESVTFPITIGVIQSEEVKVWFQPNSGGSFSGTLSIYSDDPDENPYDVSIIGSGVISTYPIGTTLWEYEITTSYDNSPKAMASIPDISGDGWDDVIVCSEDGYVRCFNGGASTTSQVLWERDIGSVYDQPDLFITDDINGDGYKEVAVGLAWGTRAIFMLSGKTGDTIWVHDTHEYGDGGWVYMVDCRYDYNDDGVIDVLAATGDDSYDTGPKRAYCLDAITGDSIWECYLAGPGFSVIGVEDFTGDGVPDAVAGASNEAETQGKVYGINGDTGSIEWTFNPSGTSVWALEQIDDITSDGIKDIIIGDFSGMIYGLDATNGGQEFSNSLGSVIILRFEKLDDVNNDSHPDILPAHSGTTARVLDGITGDSIWSIGLVDKSWNVDRASDISGDGINDVFIGTLFNNNKCYFLNGTDGSELESVSCDSAVDAITSITDIVGDGSVELVAGLRDGGVVCFSGGTGVGSGPQSIHITNMQNNWNFISLPFNQSVNKADVIVNNAGINYTWSDAVSNGYISDYIFGWNRVTQGYGFADTFEPGYGYWIYAYGISGLWAENISVTTDVFITSVKENWNIIGAPDLENIDKTDIIVKYSGTDYSWSDAVSNGYISDFIFGWNRTTQGYEFSDTLENGFSYWMYAYFDCILLG